MENATVIGLLAAVMTSSSFIPQIARTIKTRSAKDLSTGMLVFFVIGIVLWLIYGIMVNQLPVIIANCVTLVFNSVLLICKFAYR